MADAYAHTNIALIKYWGKREGPLNLPAVGSLSLTLDAFGTHTSVEPDASLAEDTFTLDTQLQTGAPTAKVVKFLDLMARHAGVAQRPRMRVVSRNDVPTAAGLASSASAFAALSVASAAALKWDVDATTLSGLARQGSGSAARSLFGGFVRLNKGSREDGQDCVAAHLPEGDGWDVKLVVASCAAGKKDVASTDGMVLTQKTSPFFAAWVDSHEVDLDAAQQAIGQRNLEKLGEVMEFNTLKMHASGMAARPGVLYWRGVTVECVHAVKTLRSKGVGAWFTMDAGPHVKVLCATADAPKVAAALAEVPGVLGVKTAGPGPAAKRLP